MWLHNGCSNTQSNYTGTATSTDQMNDEVLCIILGCDYY